MATHKDKEGSVRVTVLLEKKFVKKIDNLAKKSRTSRAEYIREVLIAAATAQTKITRGAPIFSSSIPGINSASSAKSDPENTEGGEVDKSKVDPLLHEAFDKIVNAAAETTKRDSSSR